MGKGGALGGRDAIARTVSDPGGASLAACRPGAGAPTLTMAKVGVAATAQSHLCLRIVPQATDRRALRQEYRQLFVTAVGE